ncbi:hypothetical protein [Qipengyuania marisflavi]|uniref:Uncharacterized protein n=1 Tax=Qipengyuania marisflavi TaxID=2486356 RepID=A0A5S3PA18_9SPHN|nr:hypothetical protein [Qipengyuania marisflavi]TMM50193.1 hypothetical protein FEV51_03120 [Qipengyuania marisflavi]
MGKPSINGPDNTLKTLDEGLKVDPDAYNLVAKSARLLGIQLIESNFSISPLYFEETSGKAPSIEISDVHESFDFEKGVATCIFQFETFEKRGRKKAFSLKDKFVVYYRIDCDCDELHATSFARRTGLMAVYPYFRAHLAQTSSLANADVPILPTIASMPLKPKRKN